jgi:hypothetical protein
MRTGTGILLITVGAIFRFALAAGSPHGLNVHIVGVILMVAGVAGLLLPRLAASLPLHRDRLRRWVRRTSPGRTTRHPPAQTHRSPAIGRHWSRTAVSPAVSRRWSTTSSTMSTRCCERLSGEQGGRRPGPLALSTH